MANSQDYALVLLFAWDRINSMWFRDFRPRELMNRWDNLYSTYRIVKDWYSLRNDDDENSEIIASVLKQIEETMD